MNRILSRTPNLLFLRRKNSFLKIRADPFGVLQVGFTITGAVIVGHIILLKSTFSSYISDDHGRYLVLGRELKDDEKIEKRKILVDKFVDIWSNGISPFLRWIFKFSSSHWLGASTNQKLKFYFSDIHPLAEHDLVSWLNLYRYQKPSFVKQFLLNTKEKHQRALDSLTHLEEILSDDVAVYLGFRM